MFNRSPNFIIPIFLKIYTENKKLQTHTFFSKGFKERWNEIIKKKTPLFYCSQAITRTKLPAVRFSTCATTCWYPPFCVRSVPLSAKSY